MFIIGEKQRFPRPQIKQGCGGPQSQHCQFVTLTNVNKYTPSIPLFRYSTILLFCYSTTAGCWRSDSKAPPLQIARHTTNTNNSNNNHYIKSRLETSHASLFFLFLLVVVFLVVVYKVNCCCCYCYCSVHFGLIYLVYLIHLPTAANTTTSHQTNRGLIVPTTRQTTSTIASASQTSPPGPRQRAAPLAFVAIRPSNILTCGC